MAYGALSTRLGEQAFFFENRLFFKDVLLWIFFPLHFIV